MGENDVLAAPKTKWVQGYLYESFSVMGLLPRLLTMQLLRAVGMHTDMAGIYNLPNELILRIVSYIKDRSTLPSLSLVSITFNRISTASLYRIYRNRKSEETNALLDGPSLQSFLRLILTNPGLASLVKRVDLGLWQTLFDIKSLDFYHALLAGLLPLKI